jgi:uroporphyrinogen-III synthase
VSLLGRTVLLTRDPGTSTAFIREAERLGALVIPFPTMMIGPPSSWEEADRAINSIQQYAAIGFTSANAVRGFRERCLLLGMPPERFAAFTVFAVGPQTAREAEQWGCTVAAVPEQFSAAELGRMCSGLPLNGKAVLLPRGNLAREELADCLAGLGAHVDSIEVYRNLPMVPVDAERIWLKLGGGEIDVVTFASPSSAISFAGIYPAGRLGPLSVLTAVAVIGPTTERALRDLGWEPAIVAGESTMSGLLRAIVTYFG